MFELAYMHDTVRIAPADFGKPQLQAITDWLEEKYPGRVRAVPRAAAAVPPAPSLRRARRWSRSSGSASRCTTC